MMPFVVSLFLLLTSLESKGQFFAPSVVDNTAREKWTSLDFGPDGRLYATTQYGRIFAFTINRSGANAYQVVGTEEIDLIEKIPQRSDEDGNIRPDNIRSNNPNNYELGREVTGILIAGTSTRPIIYMTSSDVRIGGSTKGDVGICTNSGIVSRLTWKHNQAPASTNFNNFTSDQLWDKVDLVRGLPRSEENHAANGLQLATINGKRYLFVCSGGNTNAGAPSLNFTKITEFALSAAILSIDLSMIEMMEQELVNTGGLLSEEGSLYVYDIPTVDDPTRANIRNPDYDRVKDITPGGAPEFEDPNDPWGGNDGLNQAKLVIGGPVQMWSPGYRNAYDLIITQDRKMYVTENGANPDWGGFPKNEGNDGQVTNEYPIANGCEPGGSFSCRSEAGEFVNNADHLAFVGNTTIDAYVPGSYYGGHPCPIRANPNGAGLYTSSGSNNIFRDKLFQNGENDPNKALPADWPPVPPSLANPVEGDYQNPGTGAGKDNTLLLWDNNTNGICEYTASNSNEAFKGDLLAANNKGKIYRVARNADGSVQELTTIATNLKNLSRGYPLDVTSQGDGEIFAGTVWVAMYNGNILVLEPNDFNPDTCLQPTQAGFDSMADYDGDGYSNEDEIQNSVDHCDPGSQPADFDGDKVSNLNDIDDDEDGINDIDDPFQIGFGEGQFEIQDLPLELNLFAATGYGFEGVGFTGLMTNRNANDDYTGWVDIPGDSPANDVIGGAAGIAKIYVTPGSSENNNQEKAYQFGVRVGQSTGNFRARIRLLGPFHQPSTGQSYGAFISNGDQDNYLKLVLVPGGIQLVKENNGVVSKSATFLVSGLFGSQSVDLYFFVNPVSKLVIPAFSTNDGVITELGQFQTNAEGLLGDAISQINTPLAVGLIGTQGSASQDYSVTYDLFEVKAVEPYVLRSITDVEVAPGSDALGIFLDNNFEDDNGTSNLNYTVKENKANGVVASISNDILFLNFPNQSSDGDITVRATDAEGNFVEDIFNVRVTSPPIVAYRNNLGGVKLLSEQGKPWTGDSNKNPSINLVNPSSNNTRVNVGNTITEFDPSVDQINVPNTVGIYATNREATSREDNMKFQFEITQEGNYEIRFYFGNNLPTNSGREFNILINGELAIANLNPFSQYGNNKGGVARHFAYLTQNTLEIEFVPLANSLLPFCSAIEVIQQTGPVAGTGSALFEVNVNSPRPLNNASTFNTNSFILKNTSGSGETIKSLTLDLATNAIPELVFDPLGTAGDNVAKTFTVDSVEGGTIDNIRFELRKPKGNGGFEQLVVFFDGTGSNAFDPGETLKFSIDIDPTSIEGISSSRSGTIGAIAGIELAGTTVSVAFNDQSVASNGLFRANNLVGSQALLDPAVPTGLQIFATDLPSPSTTTNTNPEIQIRQGEAGAEVDLLIIEANQVRELIRNNPPDTINLNLDQFEANVASSITMIENITLDSNGEANVNINLGQDTTKVYYVIAAQQFEGVFGDVSNTVILKYDMEESSGNIAVLSLDLLDADNGQVITTLSDSLVIDPGLTDGKRLTILATVNSGDVATVKMDLTGPLTVNALENFRPYALFGDGISGGNIIYTGQFFPPGDYRIQATPFLDRDLTQPGDGLDFNFTLGGTADPNPDPGCGDLPSEWTGSDVGPIVASGGVCYENDIFTLQGGGDNIWGDDDEFYYVYQDIDCDGEIIAQILDIDTNYPKAKVGVMIRETLTDDSKQAMMVIRNNGKASFQYRATSGGFMETSTVEDINTPQYVRIVRKGNRFTGYVSADKSNWVQIGSRTISMSSNVKIGLVVSSLVQRELATARFTNVEVNCEGDGGTPDPEPECNALPSDWTSQDIGAVGLNGKACFDNGTFSIEGSGSNIWATNDQFQYVYQDLNCDGEIIAQLLSIQNASRNAKVGLLIRESLSTNPRQAGLFLRPDGKASFQYRSTTGGYMTSNNLLNQSLPKYIRLQRQGNTFKGFVSSDKVNWVEVSSINIPMTQNVKIGLAVSSLTNAELCKGTFNEVEVTCGGNTNPNPDPTCKALPSEWSNQDIGSVGKAGKACFDNGTFSIEGAGDNIWTNRDEFHFVHRSLDCDGEIIAKVTGINDAFPVAKVGVMMRESLSNNSKHAIMFLRANNKASFQYRAATNGSMKTQSQENRPVPRYVRLVRSGNTFTGFISTDKVNWESVGSTNIVMGQTVNVGIFVCSHEDAILCRATFEDVEVKCEGGTAPEPNPGPVCGALPARWLNTDIGDVQVEGQACQENGIFKITAGGKDIWGTSDEFHMAFQALSCEQGEIEALVSDLVNVEPLEPWTKAGVMIRESTAPNAKYAYMLLAPQGGIALQYRTTTGGFAQSTTPIGNNPIPKYVRLRRDGDIFTGYVSNDKVSWTLIGSVTMSMNENVIIGLAVTSHRPGETVEATFEEVAIRGCGGSSNPENPSPEPGFMVFKLVDAVNNQVLDTPLEDRMQVNIGDLTRFNAIVDNVPDGTQSVKFEVLAGRYTSNPRVENSDPFSIFGDIGLDFVQRDADAGDSHRFRAEAYAGIDATGTLLESVEVGFTFVNAGGVTLSRTMQPSLSTEAQTSILYVYPNQLSGQIVNVVLSKAVKGNLKFKIHSIMGQVKAEGSIFLENENDQVQLNLQGISIEPGMYRLEVLGDDFVSQYPLVQK